MRRLLIEKHREVKRTQFCRDASDRKYKRRKPCLFHHLTANGGYRLTIKRAASQASSAAVLSVLEVAKSRQAVSSWDRLLVASLAGLGICVHLASVRRFVALGLIQLCVFWVFIAYVIR